jgi:hypothetical protein
MINGNACFAYFNKNWGIPLQIYRTDLLRLGHVCTARWIDQKLDADSDANMRDRATMDLEDLELAGVLVAFTEAPRAMVEHGGRGGRHVELGYALSRGKKILLVGPRENVFHYLPGIAAYATWAECLERL